jgi:serine/threonine protein kinase
MPDNKYEFIKVLGSGSHGATWEAQRKSDGHLVAIKIFGDRAWDEDTIEDWEWEKRMMKSLLKDCSPYAVCVLDAYIEVDDGLPRLVMDLVQGPAVYNLIVGSDAASRPLKWQYVTDLINGIQKIHKHNIVHEDIKSENIVYDKQLHIFRYIDFGLSCLKTARKAAYNHRTKMINLAKVDFPCSTYGTRYTASPVMITYTQIEPKSKRPKVPWALLQAQDYWQIGLEILRYYTFEPFENYYIDAYRKWSNDEPTDEFIYDSNLDSGHPYYYLLPQEFICSEILKISDLKVKAILMLLLDYDDYKRVQNFKLVKNIVKGKMDDVF